MSGNLVDLVAPDSGSTVLIYDVHASESGVLSILNDLYNQIKIYQNKSIKWIFVVSTPEYETTDNIIVERFPWVKKNWLYRYYFDFITTRKLLKKYKPNLVFSLQNKGIDYYRGPQIVYLHLPFIVTDHRFDIWLDGKKLWFYQNVISKSIFRSLRKVDRIIVQTFWMKDALIKKAGILANKITIQRPDISSNRIGIFEDNEDNKRRFFYPATAFTYKNHITLLKALKYAKDKGLKKYELILTIRINENNYTRNLYKFVQNNDLNVIFGGPIPRYRVFELYAKSILVFPSYIESFGLPILEARMTGSPIIASDTPFCREILEGYCNVLFFPEMSYEKMGEAILTMTNTL